MPRNLTKAFNSTHAFTLIELLVVIGIIGILATMGTINFGNAQSQSRDAKRQSDMQAISLGLRIYLARADALPDQIVATNWSSFLSFLGVAGSTPPKPNQDYCYYRSAFSDRYGLVTTDFEGALPVNAATDLTGLNLITESSGVGSVMGVTAQGRSAELTAPYSRPAMITAPFLES